MRVLANLAGFLVVSVSLLRAETPPILQEIADKWSEERIRWSFTQAVRETDGKGVVHERLERFDPSQGYDKRWHLLKLDGRTPTPGEAREWNDKKNRRKKDPKSWLEYVDLEHAKVREENAQTVSYQVPLKRAGAGLFPGDKVSVLLTVDKASRSIAHAQASIDEPFDVALGLAQVVDLDLNLQLPLESDKGRAVEKTADSRVEPKGTASAVVNRWGKRVEYTWTEFKRAELATRPRS